MCGDEVCLASSSNRGSNDLDFPTILLDFMFGTLFSQFEAPKVPKHCPLYEQHITTIHLHMSSRSFIDIELNQAFHRSSSICFNFPYSHLLVTILEPLHMDAQAAVASGRI